MRWYITKLGLSYLMEWYNTKHGLGDVMRWYSTKHGEYMVHSPNNCLEAISPPWPKHLHYSCINPMCLGFNDAYFPDWV